MPEITVSIPKELEEEFKSIPPEVLESAIQRLVKSELEKLAEFKRLVSKSKLSEEEAMKLAEEVNKDLAERYGKLYKELK